jgi:pre-mRNA-processing factor 17
VWDVASDARRLMRSYVSTDKGLRDAAFDGTGARFASAAYDKRVTLWDTETGAALASLGDGTVMYYCLTWHPSPDSPHVLLAGGGDNKVAQWDVRSGDVVQEYNYHLGPVNSVTFFDEGRQFVSTSDDKTIRVWEYGVPVQTRYIADPGMHAVPAATPHPTQPFIAMQSADNQILTYTTKDRFKAVPKKTFKGHAVAGYACRPAFSHDGRYLVSGDGDGKAWFWDWKSARVARSFKAHEGVCIDVAWHPRETSKVATAGWDGVVKYWD